MIDLDKKMQAIQENCLELARQDAKMLEEEIEKQKQEKLTEKVQAYQKEMEDKYQKEVQKMHKQWNMQVFEYEKSQKIKVNHFRENLVENIKNKIRNACIEFTNSEKYESFLMKNIATTLEKAKYSSTELDDYAGITILLVEKDYDLYREKISQMYPVKIEKINQQYIGGCMVINTNQKIQVDHTIQMYIEECPMEE